MRGNQLQNLGLLLVVVLLNTLALCQARPNISTIDWVLKEACYKRLCHKKNILTVNGEFPGPTINLHKGDRLRVNVFNQGKYGVTIHWHGVKQPRNTWSDGPEYVAQCPIKVGANYTYEIILSDEEGTLWWHAHSDWTRATVHGSINIYPKMGMSYPFPKPYGEIPILLGSWYNTNIRKMVEIAMASGADTNKSDAFTINGQPGDTQPCSTKDMFRMKVQHGKTYLLRMVNAILNENMFFMIANHNLTVVAIDAAYIKPITTNTIMITPGQTMDILLTANQSPSYYYIASRAYGETSYNNATTTAILQYTTTNYTTVTTPTTIPFPTLPDYNDSTTANTFVSKLRSLATNDHPISVPKTPNIKLFITIAVNTLPCELTNTTCAGPSGNRLSASLNNITFKPPSTDILQAYYKNLTTTVYKTDFPTHPDSFFDWVQFPMIGDNFTTSDLNGTRIKMIDYNSTVEIVFQGTNVFNASENHPMHLHGYSFYVVGMGTGNFDPKTDPNTYNLIDPPLVNTIGVPKSGWAAIRFRADNPGVWFMHCHLDRHASWGMDTVFIVKNGPTRATSLRPPHYINPC